MLNIESITDIGVSRKDNQDNFWSAILRIDGEEAGVICLCDGMGGLNNGGLASKIVVESVRDSIKAGDTFDNIPDIIGYANKTIYELGQSEEKPMGTTCTVIQCYKGRYDIYHVGDSRCYLVRDGKSLVLTIDHSALTKYNITREKDERLWRKYRNSLTRCIGVKDTVQVDHYSGTYSEGDRFLVCSDGMWHYFDMQDVSQNGVLDNLPKLVQDCIQAGEKDNITGSVLFV